jgi:DnaK suppressor protein
MAKRTVESYRDLLLDKERELRNGIVRTQRDGRDADDFGAQDMADQADSCYTKEFLFQQSSSSRDLLLLVQAALRRDEQGEFGLCVECGEPVQKKRLEAVPWACHCVACQELQEKGLL